MIFEQSVKALINLIYLSLLEKKNKIDSTQKKVIKKIMDKFSPYL